MSRETFNTPQNKGLLWNLLLETGRFNNIPENNVKQVKDDFENKIQEILKKGYFNDSLVTLNKRVLEEMTVELKKYKHPTITRLDVSNKRQNQFDQNIKIKQKEFKEFINDDKPKEITFSEEKDNPIGGEMDNLMSDAIKRREEQLNIVLQNQNTDQAENWINNDKQNSNVNIKIGDTTSLNEENIEPIEKHVSFKEDTGDFLSRLKISSPEQNIIPPPNSPHEDHIIELINMLNKKMEEMENQQKTIIEKLEQLTLTNNKN
jgi:hypothetical protein